MENKKHTIVVNPITRIEGHGKITVDLAADGTVDSARFHVTQYRGFEVFSRGRDFREMPVITPRICGICPVSHHLASAKACDASGNVIGDPNAQSACSGGGAYQCWSMAPWALSDTLAYGFAAFNEGNCGACYQIEFTGTSSSGYDDPGSASLRGKVMIVQKLNTGGIGGGQFDLLVPGGGVGDFDACSHSWGSSDLGERYGGFFLQCRNQNAGNHDAAKTCARNKCQQVFAGKPDLLDGCTWWVDWADMADNPNFNYQQVSCPSAFQPISGM